MEFDVRPARPDLYRCSATWTQYRDLLNSEFGIRITREPEEIRLPLLGHDLHVDVWEPDRTAKGVLVLVHGGGGNGRILAPLADFAVGEGWRVLAPDLPGYGLTRPAADFDWDYAGWPRVVAALANLQPAPVVLLGASLGGLTAVHAAALSGRVRGVIATTLVDMVDTRTFIRVARWPWLAAGALLGFALAPGLIDRLALPLGWLAPMKAMSSSPALQAYFAQDGLLGGARIPARFFRTLHAMRNDRLDPGCPLLLAHPGADRWTPTSLSLEVLKRVSGETTFIELSNGAHLPLEFPAAGELQVAVSGFLDRIAAAEGLPSSGK